MFAVFVSYFPWRTAILAVVIVFLLHFLAARITEDRAIKALGQRAPRVTSWLPLGMNMSLYLPVLHLLTSNRYRRYHSSCLQSRKF